MTLNKRWIGYLVGALFILSGAGLWQYFHAPTQAVEGTPVIATQAAELKGQIAEVVPDAVVKAYTKPVKMKLAKDNAIPAEIAADDNQHILASSEIASSEHTQKVTTALDAKTGETKTFTVAEPYSLFAFENKGYASIAFGYKGNALPPTMVPVGAIFVHEDLLRVYAVHLGVQGALFSDGDYFGGVAATYRW